MNRYQIPVYPQELKSGENRLNAHRNYGVENANRVWFLSWEGSCMVLEACYTIEWH